MSSAEPVLQNSSANAGCCARLAPRVLAPVEPNHKADGVLWLLARFSLVNMTKRLLITCLGSCNVFESQMTVLTSDTGETNPYIIFFSLAGLGG